jgi:hypothetical protein
LVGHELDPIASVAVVSRERRKDEAKTSTRRRGVGDPVGILWVRRADFCLGKSVVLL